jgi:hypothetical protein
MKNTQLLKHFNTYCIINILHHKQYLQSNYYLIPPNEAIQSPFNQNFCANAELTFVFTIHLLPLYH